MFYLYGTKPGITRKLVATFDTEAQMLTFVRWATLQENLDGTRKFEQGTPLVGYNNCDSSDVPLTDEPAVEVPHNPSPSML